MKFFLVFSICSAITGYCNTPHTIKVDYNNWAECVGGGGKLIQDFSNKNQEVINKDKLYISYFCNQIQEDGDPT